VKSLAKFIVRVADLLEAEGRALRESSVMVGLAVAITLVAALVAIGGVGLVAWGLFGALSAGMGPIGAAFICGVVLIASAGGLAWLAIRIGKGE
jgi:hypothetical protein